jgi:hypothetical protein
LIVVCAPAIADASNVFIATTTARDGSTAVAAADAAILAAVALPAAALPLPLPTRSSEAAPCPSQPCYFAKWDIVADTSDCQYAMGFPVCILNNFLPIFPISCHYLMSE